MVLIKEIVLDLTNFVLSNVNDAISFKPQLCYQVPAQDYVELRERYIAFTGTSMRKNKSKLYFLPTNISDELQQLNPSIPESAKRVPRDGHVYYKNRLITELDFENVKRVELACAYIAYASVNKATGVEVDDAAAESGDCDVDSGSLADPDSSAGAGAGAGDNTSTGTSTGTCTSTSGTDDQDKLSPAESTLQALRRGGVIGFRELGFLVSITPWHFHRVFKVITGLTIREYGQLCTEFVKKNRDIMNACKKKIEELKAQGLSFHCFDEPEFLKDGSLCYEPTTNVVLLPEYFIDPNKSKEHKKKQKESKTSDGKCSQRVEARKRRSSVMSGRIRRASQTSIASSSSIQDPLHSEVSYPSTPQLSPSDQAASHHHLGNSVTASPVMGLNLGGSMDAPAMATRPLNSQYLAKSRRSSLVPSASGVLSSALVSGKVLKPRSSGGATGGGPNYIRKMSEPSLALAARGLQNQPLDTDGDEISKGITTVTSATDLSLHPVLSPQIDFKFDIFGTAGSREDPMGSGSCVASGSASAASLSVAETDSAQTPSNANGESRTVSSLTAGSSNGSLNTGFADEIAPNVLASADQNEYSIGMPAGGNSSTATTSVQGFTSRANESLPRGGSIHTLLDDISGLEPEENMLLDINAMHDEDLSGQQYGFFGPKAETGIHNSNSFTNLPNYAASFLHQDQQGPVDLQMPQQVQLGHQQFSAQDISALSGGELPYSRNRLNSVAPEMDDLDRMFLSGYEGSTPGLSSALAAQFSTDSGTLGMDAHLTSEQSTRDNTMATTATTATADTSDSTRAFEDKNTLNSYTHLGFDTLSPCASPTSHINQSSFETMISSSANDEIVGNQFHFVQ
ncbi:LAQU0S02e05050g1_1 [Lachancea quebecensis]|uniref:LAQU0S02e05050g1_1 n=1 Tax=Lachancea quebecensis TaxID=1654605 RepID=A0A0N7ML21_9SACH|nr:LAQU0S02e05050g1_1 [Lachancea quebecensis]